MLHCLASMIINSFIISQGYIFFVILLSKLDYKKKWVYFFYSNLNICTLGHVSSPKTFFKKIVSIVVIYNLNNNLLIDFFYWSKVPVKNSEFIFFVQIKCCLHLEEYNHKKDISNHFYVSLWSKTLSAHWFD